jgi:hypothetical protein
MFYDALLGVGSLEYTDLSVCYTLSMKYQYFSLRLELLLPRRHNWVDITSFFAIGLCVSFCKIAKVLVIAVG